MNKLSLLTAAAVLALNISVSLAIANEDTAPLPELTAQWWQWAVSIPAGQNPQTDPNGDNCMIGQRGDVWFLGGVFSGGPATRACSVPEGSTLFFPVINEININAPNVCGQGADNLWVKDLRQQSKAFINAVPLASVKVQVDNNKVAFGASSQVFAVALQDDNVFDAPCGGPETVPAGIFSPAVDDGYYVRLGPLERGGRALNFQAAQPTQPAPTDVTYQLTVVPVSLM